MSIADASQQREAARARWRGRVVSRAAALVVERADEVTGEQWEQLRLAHNAAEEAARRAAVARTEGRSR